MTLRLGQAARIPWRTATTLIEQLRAIGYRIEHRPDGSILATGPEGTTVLWEPEPGR